MNQQQTCLACKTCGKVFLGKVPGEIMMNHMQEHEGNISTKIPSTCDLVHGLGISKNDPATADPGTISSINTGTEETVERKWAVYNTDVENSQDEMKITLPTQSKTQGNKCDTYDICTDSKVFQGVSSDIVVSPLQISENVTFTESLNNSITQSVEGKSNLIEHVKDELNEIFGSTPLDNYPSNAYSHLMSSETSETGVCFETTKGMVNEVKDLTPLQKEENIAEYPLSINSSSSRGVDSTSAQDVIKQVSQSGFDTDVQVSQSGFGTDVQVSQSGFGTDVQVSLSGFDTDVQVSQSEFDTDVQVSQSGFETDMQVSQSDVKTETQFSQCLHSFTSSDVSTFSINPIAHTAIFTPESQQVNNTDATDILTGVISQTSRSVSNASSRNIAEYSNIPVSQFANINIPFSTNTMMTDSPISSGLMITDSHVAYDVTIPDTRATKRCRKLKKGRQYSCNKCDKSFKQYQSYKRHVCPTAERKTCLKAKTSHSCDRCSVTCVTKKELQNHLREFHTKNSSLFICKICGQNWSTLKQLKLHKKKHDEKQQCNTENCDETVEEALKDVSQRKNTDPMAPRKIEKSVHFPNHDKKLCRNRSLKRHMKHVNDKKGKTKMGNVYECDICDQKFTDIKHYDRHMFKHTGEKRYKCTICGKLYMYRAILWDHQRRAHSDKKPAGCDVCGKGFAMESQLKIHLRTHTGEKPYLCDICGSAFSTPGGLSSHITRWHSKDKLPFPCGQCEKSFPVSYELKMHQRRHTKEKLYKCDFCDKTFYTGYDRKCHQGRMHIRDKPLGHQEAERAPNGTSGKHHCDICGHHFSRIVLYERHMWKHTGIKQHQCNICGNGYVTVSSLNEHKLKVHSAKKLSVCKPVSKSSRKQIKGKQYSCDKFFKQLRPYKRHVCISTAEEKNCQKANTSHSCDICSVTCVSKVELQNHLRKHHTKNSSLIMCDICGQNFSTSKHLKQHKKEHDEIQRCSKTVKEASMEFVQRKCTDALSEKRIDKTIPCPHCDERISDSSNRNLRIRCVHCKKAKTKMSSEYECDICGQKFTNLKYYDIHMFKHTGEKRYKCTICGKLYMYRSILWDHQRRAHSDKKPAGCDVCGKGFAMESQLKIHLRTHTGEKPYLCEICGSAFSTPGGLSSHITRWHSKDKLPFPCGQCEKSFPVSYELKMHQRRHTKEKLYKCDFCEKTFYTGYDRKCHQGRMHIRDEPLGRQETHTREQTSNFSLSGKLHKNYLHNKTKLSQSLPASQTVCTSSAHLVVPASQTSLSTNSKVSHSDCSEDTMQVSQVDCSLDIQDTQCQTRADIRLLQSDGNVEVSPYFRPNVSVSSKDSLPNGSVVQVKQKQNKGSTKVDSRKDVNGKKRQTCNICGNEFVTISSLNEHMLKVHSAKKLSVCKPGTAVSKSSRKQTKGKQYSCDKCGEIFKKLQSYKRHVCISTTEKKTCQKANSSHSCDICSVTCVSKVELQNHLREHHSKNSSLFMCEICGQNFSTSEHLKWHKKEHDAIQMCGTEASMDVGQRKNIDVMPEKEIDKTIGCPHCGKRISGRSNLYRHIRRVHCKKVKTKMTSEYECDICGQKFINLKYYDRHMFKHTGEKRYKCTICGKLYMYRLVLWDHQRRAHSDKKPLACDVCGKDFAMESQLKIHLRTHTGEKPYLCEVCSSAFSTPGGLSSHTIRLHSKEKLPFPCGQCGKRFASTNELKQHQRRHTGEKPYKCNYCEKKFCTGAERKHHQTIHTGEKAFKCRYCEKVFRHRSSLASHQVSHSNRRDFKCSICQASFKLHAHLNRHQQTHKT